MFFGRFLCFVFPFCCVLRLFSHQLEGVDPSSYVAYPRVVVPAPRPSEARGRRRARPVGPGLKVSGYFFALLCLAEGHRDPGTFLEGRGRFLCPLRSLFHTHTPGLFFFFHFMGLWGPACTQDCSDA